MKIAQCQSLLPSIVCVQPYLAWLLACVPGLVPADRREQVRGILEDLTLKYTSLQGQALELEGTGIEVEDTCILAVNEGKLGVVEGPAVIVVGTESPTAAEWADTEAILRNALAQVIVSRGEAELLAVGEKIEELEEGGCNGCPCTGPCTSGYVSEASQPDPRIDRDSGEISTNDFRADGRPDPEPDPNDERRDPLADRDTENF